MCADIMLLSNTFIYGGRLKCGTETVASRTLNIPNPEALQMHHPKPSHQITSASPDPQSDNPTNWLAHTLSPTSPVIFLNTDTTSLTLETASGSRITNTLEARLITHLTLSLLSAGLPASEIGVIAFYRSQLALLKSCLQSAGTQTQTSIPTSTAAAGGSGGGAEAIELHTADKFQGRDKEVIFVSCVRSNEARVVGDLLRDRRRVNVALTRARSKLGGCGGFEGGG
ncbi:uncharacterized protein BDR25DRAFT_116237 [Lindgomyces ingoldianus]|uniref:Uncharacterized protein n=1 Tax=Lindgomyces ingoldianus TaxID=673940 RepID=A0ACB6Q8F6_9PLEO|nr:uncharacterized protein BDR25DRAFT_116237 [Lindgomyces ingoldianus]KAF2463218.1 hypothetical protein BDR25DRAFT_116237 [Lindgomyces ingoldianus]